MSKREKLKKDIDSYYKINNNVHFITGHLKPNEIVVVINCEFGGIAKSIINLKDKNDFKYDSEGMKLKYKNYDYDVETDYELEKYRIYKIIENQGTVRLPKLSNNEKDFKFIRDVDYFENRVLSTKEDVNEYFSCWE